MASWNSFTFKLTKIDNVVTAAMDLERRIKRGGMRDALNNASTIMLRKAKQLCPKGPTGLLKRSLTKKAVTNTAKDEVTVYIGSNKRTVGTYKKQRVKPSRYMHLVELGHAGPHPAPAHPFLRPAYDATHDEVMRKYAQDLRGMIERRTKRLTQRR